jgi:hypothetical protein
MTRKRITSTVAALGGVTAALALLTGIPSARADELSDLRANQELLQRRVDQLAQGSNIPAGGAPAAPAGGPQVGMTMAGGSFPRSFLIPGTDTSLRVGGFVDLTMLYFLSGGTGPIGNYSTNAGNNGALQGLPLDIHGQTVPGAATPAPNLNHSKGNGVFEWSPQQSKLTVETRTPTAYGEARTVFEFDWSGCSAFSGQPSANFSCSSSIIGGSNSILPRLRFAYGTLGGLLVGQANSLMNDPDADSETLEFGNSVGAGGRVRIPQVRYTLTGPWGSSFAVSLESPTSDTAYPFGFAGSDTVVSSLPSGPGTNAAPAFCNGVACSPAGGGGVAATNASKSPAPDLNYALYFSQPWGHLDLSGVVRDLEINDGRFISRNYLGYGGHFSGHVITPWFGWEKDTITWHAVAGSGAGNYMNGGASTWVSLATNFTVPTTCATPIPGCGTGVGAAFSNQAASNVLVHPVTAWGGNVGYQHWWASNLRSTIAFGVAHQDVSSNLIGPTQDQAVNKELVDAYVNIVWNPVPFITTGVQYFWGHRQVVANLKGDENVIVAKFRVTF